MQLDEFNHIFLSYAHVDNQAVPGAEFGWVTYLHRVLKPHLERALGSRVKVWFDQSQLRGNHLLAPEIEREIERSATFVAILSPGYLASSWCRREIELFATHNGGTGSGRIFAVDLQGLQKDQRTAIGLGDLMTYRFWYTDQDSNRIRTYGDPQPTPEERDYYRLVCDLANDIARTVRDRVQPQPALVANSLMTPPAGPPIPHADARLNGNKRSVIILLSEVTDDLEPSRQQLRRYLEQAGLPVRQMQSYGLKPDEFAEALDQELAQASIFVQLLSRVPYRSFPGGAPSLGALQHNRALEAGVRIMQWREPGPYADQIDDEQQRALLTGEAVLAVSFESFKKAIVDASAAKTTPSQHRSSYLFINADKRDLELARQIQSRLTDVAAVALPLAVGTAEELRTDIEENLVDCDGLLIVYGDGSAAWVHQQLRLYNKFLPKRQKPIRLVAVIEAPPSAKREIGISLPGLQMLDHKSGINHQTLRDLLLRATGGLEQ